jgi:hypothetical protein
LNSAYSTSLIGGSGYFDGTGDFLNTTSSSNLAFGTGDFTVDFWIYATSLPASDNNILNQNLASGTPQFYIDSSGKLQYRNAFVGAILTSNTTFKAGQWYYCAIARASGTSRMFINGALDTSASDTTNWSNTAGWYVSNNSGPFTGYMAGSRLIKGTALYTQAFAPPTTPPTAITNTQLLLNYTNGAIFDNTAKVNLETIGNAQISTAQSKYGGSSMSFDGTGDSLKGKLNNAVGGGDYTIECWIYTGASSARYIFDMRETSQALGAFTVGTTLYVNLGATLDIVATTTYPQNAWNHFAMVRTGSGSNNTSVYLNGLRILQVTNTTNFSTIPTLYIGNDNTGAYSWNGYIQDFRITQGYARYLTNFTPPTSQLQDQ